MSVNSEVPIDMLCAIYCAHGELSSFSGWLAALNAQTQGIGTNEVQKIVKKFCKFFFWKFSGCWRSGEQSPGSTADLRFHFPPDGSHSNCFPWSGEYFFPQISYSFIRNKFLVFKTEGVTKFLLLKN